MNRQKFLSITGLSFLGTLFFSGRTAKSLVLTQCNDPITPPVPEGPYYKKEKLLRVDITENKKGTPIEYLFKVEDKDCKPIKGAIVDIWQCDADGRYSDFEQENSLGQTWLRGYQVTDSNGECRFLSIFPGWYNGRITHIHAKVYVNNKPVLTTNMYFPKEAEDKVFQSPLYPRGSNPVSISGDIELRVDNDMSRHDALVMKIEEDSNGKLIGRFTIALA